MARVLVVDDEKNVRRMVRLTLTREGHTVADAEDGRHGLEHFGSGAEVDLVLVDQRMPGMDGRALIQELRRRDPCARIVMITAFDTVQLAAEVIQAGATDFLRKPFSTETLRGAVAVALARPRVPGGGRASSEAAAPVAGSAQGISFWLNGFRYWPVAREETRGVAAPHGMEVYRAFDVVGAYGDARRCLVGITPHVCEEVQAALRRRVTDDAPVWDVLCGSALVDFLWAGAQMPPEIVPLYDLTLAQRQAIADMPAD